MATIAPHYATYIVYGPFHRLQGTGATQTVTVAKRQLVSGELWGRPSRFSGDVPLAQAHRGRLPPGSPGIEFVAFAPPDKRWGAPEWRTPITSDSGEALVWTGTDAALGPVVKVRIAITRVTQVL